MDALSTMLDAVNLCLSAIGESRVNTIEGASVEARDAVEHINLASSLTQSRGWHWNTFTAQFPPDYEGRIHIPSNVILADTTDKDRHIDVTLRGRKVVNKNGMSDTFQFPLTFECYELLEWEDLPLVARNYIAKAARYEFYLATYGATGTSVNYFNEMTTAHAQLKAHETDVGDYNMLTSANAMHILKRKI